MCALIPTVADDVIQILTVLGLNIAVKGDFILMYVVGVVLLRNATKIRTVQLLMNVVTPTINVYNVRIQIHLLFLTKKS